MKLPRVIRTVKELRNWRLDQLRAHKQVGFVPTMGALHRGHLNLVNKSLQENDSTIVSIFVNPSQFAPGEDLDDYPRTFDTDLNSISALSPATSDNLVVFQPTVSEMYPTGITLDRNQQKGAFVAVQGLSEQLEGAIRPQFFRGVATVVAKLFNATTPDRAYFGQKDVQQTIVIKRMVKDLLMPVEVVVVPTAREESGLAMSSRNEYLSEEMRQRASILYRAMQTGEKSFTSHKSAGKAVKRSSIVGPIVDMLQNADFPLEIEYIALSDIETLQEVQTVEPGCGAVITGAVRVPNKAGATTRIIDNIILS